MALWGNKDYYVYAFLREDGSPYYVGKGIGYRAYSNTGRTVHRPTCDSRIVKLETGLDEETAYEREIFYIAKHGRKDNGTGILRNLTDGGEGLRGRIFSEEHKERLRDASLGINNHRYGTKRPKTERQKLSKSKSAWWKIRMPNGDIVDVLGLNAFCREYDLKASSLYKTYVGQRKHHKNYSILEKLT